MVSLILDTCLSPRARPKKEPSVQSKEGAMFRAARTLRTRATRVLRGGGGPEGQGPCDGGPAWVHSYLPEPRNVSLSSITSLPIFVFFSAGNLLGNQFLRLDERRFFYARLGRRSD